MSADGWTVLRAAASGGSAEDLRELIAAGADVRTQNLYCKTALHVASGGGSADAEQALLLAGDDVHARDREGKSALHH